MNASHVKLTRPQIFIAEKILAENRDLWHRKMLN
jgi:hypothetical protein